MTAALYGICTSELLASITPRNVRLCRLSHEPCDEAERRTKTLLTCSLSNTQQNPAPHAPRRKRCAYWPANTHVRHATIGVSPTTSPMLAGGTEAGHSQKPETHTAQAPAARCAPQRASFETLPLHTPLLSFIARRASRKDATATRPSQRTMAVPWTVPVHSHIQFFPKRGSAEAVSLLRTASDTNRDARQNRRDRAERRRVPTHTHALMPPVRESQHPTTPCLCPHRC